MKVGIERLADVSSQIQQTNALLKQKGSRFFLKQSSQGVSIYCEKGFFRNFKSLEKAIQKIYQIENL